MNEVKKCSIAGLAFTFDEDAYQKMSQYLDSLNKAYKNSADGAEIIADIEARVAELILSAQSQNGVVEKALVENIIRQLGSAEDISEKEEDPDSDLEDVQSEIPKRLYRVMEDAKLGGVCSGLGKYFQIDPVWFRCGIMLSIFLPFLGKMGLLWEPFALLGNVAIVLVICYIIIWFTVPVARTARQKLEMEGKPITAQSVAARTSEQKAQDVDHRAKPIVAETVSLVAQILLICLKIFAGLIVAGLIGFACTLVILIFVLLITGGTTWLSLPDMDMWLAIMGVLILLIPTMVVIYILMCLIFSRRLNRRSLVVFFLLWLMSVIGSIGFGVKKCGVTDVEELNVKVLNVNEEMKQLRYQLQEGDDGVSLQIDSSTTTQQSDSSSPK